jgi:hypothetical protein
LVEQEREAQMRKLLISAVLLLCGAAAQAADEKGAFAVKGAGAETCAAYLAARERDPAAHAMFLGWLDGYLSAVNELTPGVFDVAFWRERGILAALMQVNCRDNSQQRFVVVARAMVRRLAEKPLAEASPLTEARIGERGVPLYRATVREVEKALAERGLDPGPIDGEWDDEASRALLLFQREQEELTPTGLPDQATLAKLLGVAP